MSDIKECKVINVDKENSFAGSINIISFYGSVSNDRRLKDIPDNVIIPLDLSPKFRKLSSPSIEWKTFKKQQDAINHVTASNLEVIPFTYQNDNGDRLFLTAHPKSFWYIDEQRNPDNRHSYEIIQEFRPCKLYFDLEFDRIIHQDLDGYSMVKLFIDHVCTVLKRKYSISCDESNILNLDSTSETKFSCHLIFQNVNFANNYEVGRFVKLLCHEIRSLKKNSEFGSLLSLNSRDSIQKLFVSDSKGNQKLFCDEGVYTKNRHFRLYKSSKFGKNVSLKVSKYNSFKIQGDSHASKEEFTFLCSLITYYDSQPKKLLRCEIDASDLSEFSKKVNTNPINNNWILSPYTDIDRCISVIVDPGKIYRSNFFPEKKIIVYDIIGNRYCGNIGREHKSNNVKFIVNVSDLTYYQKCHDPDCAEYKSEKKVLPINEKVFINHNIDDEIVLSSVLQLESFAEDIKENEFQKCNEDIIFDDSDDETLLVVSERCESMINPKNRKLENSLNENEMVLSTDEKCESSMEVDAFSSTENDIFICSVTERCELLINASEKGKTADTFLDNNIDHKLTITAEECESNVKKIAKKYDLDAFSDNIGDDVLIQAMEQYESSFKKSEAKVDEFLISDSSNDAIIISVAEQYESLKNSK